MLRKYNGIFLSTLSVDSELKIIGALTLSGWKYKKCIVDCKSCCLEKKLNEF